MRFSAALFIAIFLCSGCHNFYKSQQSRTGDYTSKTIDSLQKQNKFFFLRAGSHAFFMKDIAINADKKILTCLLDTMPAEHQLHLVNGRHGRRQYKKSNIMESNVLNEVHLYVSPGDSIAAGDSYSLRFDQLQKIEVIEKDKGRTRKSYILGGLAYTAATLTVVGIIAAASGGWGSFEGLDWHP